MRKQFLRARCPLSSPALAAEWGEAGGLHTPLLLPLPLLPGCPCETRFQSCVGWRGSWGSLAWPLERSTLPLGEPWHRRLAKGWEWGLLNVHELGSTDRTENSINQPLGITEKAVKFVIHLGDYGPATVPLQGSVSSSLEWVAHNSLTQ